MTDLARPRRLGLRSSAAAVLLILSACAHGETQQSSGPVITLAAVGSARFDDNVRRQSVPAEGWGGGGELLLRVADRSRAPRVQLEYGAGARHSDPADPSDGTGHRLNALVGTALSGPVRLDLIGRLNRGGVDEDLNSANDILVGGRMSIQPARSTRVRAYASMRWRESEAGPPSEGGYAGIDLRQTIPWSLTAFADTRFEVFRPADASRDWHRAALSLGLARPLTRTTALEVEARHRIREYPGRLVESDDERAEPRRDEDWRFAVALVRDAGRGTEIRLEFERDSRWSNEPRRIYDANRAAFIVRRRVLGFGGRREPPRIDERPVDEAIRARTGPAPDAIALASLLVAGLDVCTSAESGVLCWEPDAKRSAAPVLTPGAWHRLAAGAGRLCGINAERKLYCWTPAGGHLKELPTGRSAAEDVRFADVAVGDAHACALSTIGRAYCWGDSSDGQLGTGRSIPEALPVPVSGDVRFRSIAVGGRHTCALDADGAPYCWGANESGQAAAGSLPRVPQPRSTGDHRFTHVSAGARHSCALDDAGHAWCWGDNSYGQAGADGRGSVREPGRLPTDLRFTAISAGWAHTCALSTSGTAYCWGANRFGQLGTGRIDPEPHSRPGPVAGPRDFVRIDASFRTCALDSRLVVHCWGGSGSSPADDTRAALPRPVGTVPPPPAR